VCARVCVCVRACARVCGCVCVCVCVRVCVLVCTLILFVLSCVQVEAFRRADLPPKEPTECVYKKQNKSEQTPWPEFASELYRPNDCHLSTKIVPNFADSGYHVVSVTDPCGRILDFLDRADCV
jgi:hypothetical protein